MGMLSFNPTSNLVSKQQPAPAPMENKNMSSIKDSDDNGENALPPMSFGGAMLADMAADENRPSLI